MGCTCATDGNAFRCHFHTQEDYDQARRQVGEIRTATVLRPGDHVLLTVSDTQLTPEDLDGMVAALSDRFPDVRFTIAAGISDIAVQPKEGE